MKDIFEVCTPFAKQARTRSNALRSRARDNALNRQRCGRIPRWLHKGVMFPTWSVQNLRAEIMPDHRELLVPLSLATPSGYQVKYQHADIGLIWKGDGPLHLSGTPQLLTP